MADFAVIIHPVNVDLIHIFDPGTSSKNPQLLRKVLEWTPAFYTCPIEGIRSITGKEVQGHFVMCPLLPDQILNHNPNFVAKKVLETLPIVRGLDVKLLGLAAYVSLVGRKGTLIAKNIDIPVTTGTAYTIAMALEASSQAAHRVGIRLESCKAVVIGATGSIGSICSSILSGKVRQLTLVARNKQRLSDLALSLAHKGAVLQTADDSNEAIFDADLIICATNTPATLIDARRLKSGAVVCDVSQPHNIDPEAIRQRDDILVIDGGVVKPPGAVNFNFNFGLSPGLVFACIAETLILALEERYESYSLGGNISLAKIREIYALGKKHGFQLSELRSFDKPITDAQIERVKEVRASLRAGQ